MREQSLVWFGFSCSCGIKRNELKLVLSSVFTKESGKAGAERANEMSLSQPSANQITVSEFELVFVYAYICVPICVCMCVCMCERG